MLFMAKSLWNSLKVHLWSSAFSDFQIVWTHWKATDRAYPAIPKLIHYLVYQHSTKIQSPNRNHPNEQKWTFCTESWSKWSYFETLIWFSNSALKVTHRQPFSLIFAHLNFWPSSSHQHLGVHTRSKIEEAKICENGCLIVTFSAEFENQIGFSK